MKTEIYEEPKQPAVKPKEPLRLRLVPRDDGSVLLRAVHADGSNVSCGAIIQIDPDGSIYRCSDVSRELGLPVDRCGRVLMRDE